MTAKLRPDQKLVAVTDELFQLMARPGETITVAWGEPDADGIYNPTIYRHTPGPVASWRARFMGWLRDMAGGPA